jgi:CheY-like chemotaxis protein
MLIKTFNILLIEDNPADIRLIEEAFKESDINTELSVVNDGIKAMEFLKHGKNYEDAPIPDLILLDLNLPLKDGREVLKEIKDDINSKHIPVVIVTTSSTEKDVYETYANHANSYIVKPANVGLFIDIMKNLEFYWFDILKLP